MKMLGYVIALLITNTFYCSVGLPVPKKDGPLANSLQLLANHCENTFLSTQIKNKLDDCNITLSAQGKSLESELECFIFYDINSQLCAAFGGSKVDLSQKYAATIENFQKIEMTCNVSKNWKFTKLADYPMYNMSETVFKNPVTCIKACGVDDISSVDTNFYCKYYQWGSELLQLQGNQETIPLSGSVVSNSGLVPAVVETSSKTDDKATLPISTNKVDAQNIQSKSEQPVDDQVKVEPSIPEPIPIHLGKPALPANTGQMVNENANIKLPDVHKGPSAGLLDESSPKNVVEKPELIVPPLKEDDNSQLLNSNDINKTDLQNQSNLNDQNIPDEEDFDPQDDALPDTSGSEGNGLESDPKNPNEEKPKTPSKNGASIVSAVDRVEMSHREFFSNTMQDGFAEDDDHFFSFFLTAIILAIVLYVLYHNKSKFRKVFLGLLVEGRQSGRRRNSRGHEYRRLDTLEQAMSTNSAAPPSKIIY
ncbi:uncharacterized protein [Epargyreus clarus]|uniref:uncharacterized protein n=1 Tax=Epargyreus clarus TaxID=520877 RepID=UPI003C2D48B8